jgi:hypothetical protein
MNDQTIITLNFHNDGGHGWLECNRELISSTGIEENISKYSYQRGNDVYLEEDCDMPLLLDALRKRSIGVVVNNMYQDESPVRKYARYTK